MKYNTVLEPPDSDFMLFLRIFQTQWAMYKFRSSETTKIGLTPKEAAVLFTIDFINNNGDEPTPGEISRRIFKEPHTVSALLTRMQKRGLIEKYKDLEKKTMVRVMVTAKGRRLFKESTRRESIRSIMAVLSDDERKSLTSILDKLLAQTLGKLGTEQNLEYMGYGEYSTGAAPKATRVPSK